MKIRNMLFAAATFGSLAGGAGSANAPQGSLQVGTSFHNAVKHNGPRAEVEDEGVRDAAIGKNPAARMTAAQRRAHRKNLGINFYRRDSGTVVADRK